MMNLQNILQQIGERGVERVRSELQKQDKVVSGETYNSVRYVITEKALEIRAKASIMTLVNGRKPTKNSGSGEVLKAIKAWVKKRGIPDRYAYAITRKIHQEGIKVPNAYTSGNLLKEAFEGFNNEIKQIFLNGYNS